MAESFEREFWYIFLVQVQLKSIKMRKYFWFSICNQHFFQAHPSEKMLTIFSNWKKQTTQKTCPKQKAKKTFPSFPKKKTKHLPVWGSNWKKTEDLVTYSFASNQPHTRAPMSNMLPDVMVTGPDFLWKGYGGWGPLERWRRDWDRWWILILFWLVFFWFWCWVHENYFFQFWFWFGFWVLLDWIDSASWDDNSLANKSVNFKAYQQLSLGFGLRIKFHLNIHELQNRKIFKPRVFSCLVQRGEVCFCSVLFFPLVRW